jgi:hypothetical protein
MDKAQKPSNSEFYTPSPEPFKIYLNFMNVIAEDSCFVGEVGAGGPSPRKKTGSSHLVGSPARPNSDQRDSQATDSRHHLVNLRDQLRSVLKSNPSRETGVFGGNDSFVYINVAAPFGHKRSQDNSHLTHPCDQFSPN